jgi:hypothetical protein
MMYGIKRVVRYFLGTDIAGRALAVYPDDTFVVSYPRSGNTWTRFLIANLLQPHQAVTFANIERIIPDSEAHSNRYLKRIPRPRIIKSHSYFDHRYKKVIYIVRDPRDVVLSYYDFQRKYRHIKDDYPVLSYVSNFITGKLGSAEWGTWGENVGSWLATRAGKADFLLLRYEDMKNNAEQELGKVASFLGIERSPALLANAVEQSSADRMRILEKNQSHQWVATRNRRDDIPFVRSAVSGSWKSKLPAAAVAEIEAAWGSLMRDLGYATGTQLHSGSDMALTSSSGVQS